MKILDKVGLTHLWSVVKTWAESTFVPSSRTVNSKALTTHIELRASDIPYSSTESVKDVMEDVRNVMLAGDTITDVLHSNASDYCFVGMNPEATKGTAPSASQIIFNLMHRDKNKTTMAETTAFITSSNNAISRIRIRNPISSASSGIETLYRTATSKGYICFVDINDTYIGTDANPALVGHSKSGWHISTPTDGTQGYLCGYSDDAKGPHISGTNSDGNTVKLYGGTATKDSESKLPDIGGKLMTSKKIDITVATDPNGAFVIDKAYLVGCYYFMYGHVVAGKNVSGDTKTYSSGDCLLPAQIKSIKMSSMNFIPNGTNYTTHFLGRVKTNKASDPTFMIECSKAITANQYFTIFGIVQQPV